MFTALDYDTLIISRIYDYRLEGHSTDQAILRGLDKTGGIITLAGMIMMVAFSSLMVRQNNLNQYIL
jgi:RND superfamily putative drug exporter